MSAITSPSKTRATMPIIRRPLRERVTPLLPWRAQDVPHAAHGVHKRWFEAVDLAPQVADVRLEHARVAPEVVMPHVIEDLAAGQDAARVDQQVAQQPVLGG